MPSYGGSNIFGQAVEMRPAAAERAAQRAPYFGLNGYLLLDGGSRGGATIASGVLIGDSAEDLSSQLDTFRSFQDNVQRTLVNTRGESYDGVVLRLFEEDGRTIFDEGKGYAQKYKATFEHIQ